MASFQKVALVSLPKQDLLRPPAALPILASICESIDVDYTINDFNLWLYKNLDPQTWQEIDDNWMKFDSFKDTQTDFFQKFRLSLAEFTLIILDQQPDIIAISVFTQWSAHCAYELITEIKKQNFNIKILIGGSGIDTVLDQLTEHKELSDWLLENKLIDFYIHGEGEILFKNVLLGNTVGPGLNNHNFQQIDDLNQFPYPSYKKINPSDYNYISVPTVMINGSRGCVRHCTYCDVAKYWPKFRYKSGHNLANEIYYTWKHTGIVMYEFSDSLINGSIREFKNMNTRLVELKQQNKNFNIEYKGQFICRSANQFKEQDYKIMKAAGCNYLYVGIETFSQKVRYDMDKKFDNDAVDFHFSMCAKYGIANVLLMIVGYPTELLKDHLLNLDGLRKYQHYAQAGIIEMITFGFTTSILSDTPLYLQKDALEIVPEFTDLTLDANWISLKNPDLTFAERVRRWIELTELANDLGYNQPRIDAIVKRFEQVLVATKLKRKVIQLRTIV